MIKTVLEKKLAESNYGGSRSVSGVSRVLNEFHDGVIRELLLGNRVLLPGGISAEIVRFETRKHTIRIGYDYRLMFRMGKLKKKRVMFIPYPSFKKKLDAVLKNTSVEYKLVKHGYK